MRFEHHVSISANGVTKTYPYYGSVVGYKDYVAVLSNNSVLHFIESVIADALSATYTHEEFCMEFGFDDPCDAVRMRKQCNSMLEDMKEMGFAEDMLYDMQNELLCMIERI